MIVAWIGYAMLCSAGLGALAACVERLFERRRYERRVLWLGAMATSVLVPIGLSWNARPGLATHGTGRAVGGEAIAARGVSIDLDAVALTVWAVATLVGAAWLVVSQARLRRSLRRCNRARIDGVEVIVTRDFGPAVVGVLRPEIVLPSWVLSLDETDRRLVVAHECEHERGRDPAMQLVALAIAVAFPWNLALWWQLKRLRLAIEIDCDARVVDRHRVHPARYGELLVRAHDAAPSWTASALALVQSKSTLARRVDALLGLPRHSAARMFAAGAAGVTLASLVAFSPAPPIRRASLPSTVAIVPSAASVERRPDAAPSVARASAALIRRPTATAAARATRTLDPDRATEEPRVPPMRIMATGIEAATPAAAALPTRRAVVVPRATGGFVRATAGDSNAVRAAGGFARATGPDSVRRGSAAAAGPATAGAVRAVSRPPTP